ncbi:MAG: hypothetical protein M2R45_03470 [Verrucomicrobia subdivision 3 bacterium]|nr:hypothetical protein [Limisphaerales bacterium]MCS1416679.1 hypothetical protein [Limisphaerales bacterium]
MNASAATTRSQSLGILLAVSSDSSSFTRAIRLAKEAQAKDINVFLYLLDDAVVAASQPDIQNLAETGVKITACAYAAKRRSLHFADHITYGGLSILNDIIMHSDRFISFCH